MRLVKSIIATGAGIVLALTGSLPVFASDMPETDPQVVQMLEAVPGGILVDAQTAVWPELGMELSVPSPGGMSARAAVGTCPSGAICAFGEGSLNGARLSFTGCGVLPVPATFTTRSMADARASGYAQARNGSTVLATATAGSWTNVSGTTTNIRCLL